MKKVFIDTNVLLDLIMKRRGFYQDAKRLFDYCEQKNIKIYTLLLNIIIFHIQLEHQMGFLY